MIKGAAWCLLLAVLGSFLTAAPAAAHATILSSTPSDTSVVDTAPREVRMRWSESVDLGRRAVQLLDANGAVIKTAPAKHDRGGASTAVLTLPPGLGNGTYVIAWRVVSADSHPVSGAFSFSVGAPSAVILGGAGESSRAVELVDAVGRGVAFAGLALAVGGACLLLLLWPEGSASVRGRRLFWGGIGALLAGTVAVLLLQGPYGSGGALTEAFSPSLLGFSLSTRFGLALVLRIALTVAFALLVARALGGARDRLTLAAAGACAVGLIATWTFTDHSRTGVQTWLGVPAASLHVLAMALWLGGLTVLLVCVLGRTSPQQVSLIGVLPRFSRLALACFAALGVTGVYLAWRQSGALPALPATAFGRLLLVKSGIVVVIVGLAALSRRAVARGGPDRELARRLRRSVAGEAVLGVAVLGVTAVLVNTTPARVGYGPPLDVTVTAPGAAAPSPLGLARIELHMDSTKQGQNVTDVYLVARNGNLYVPPELTARLIPPGDDVGPLKADFGGAEPGHYVATRLSFPFPGRWTLRLQIRTSDIDETDIDIPVRIRG